MIQTRYAVAAIDSLVYWIFIRTSQDSTTSIGVRLDEIACLLTNTRTPACTTSAAALLKSHKPSYLPLQQPRVSITVSSHPSCNPAGTTKSVHSINGLLMQRPTRRNGVVNGWTKLYPHQLPPSSQSRQSSHNTFNAYIFPFHLLAYVPECIQCLNIHYNKYKLKGLPRTIYEYAYLRIYL